MGHKLSFAMPSARVLSAASTSSKVVNSTTQVTNKVDDFVSLSTRTIIPRAPSGGIVVNGKYYKGGQFLPGSHITIFYGRGGVPGHGLLRGSSTYPLPTAGYPQLSGISKWSIGIGGSLLAFEYGWNKNVTKKLEDE